MVKKSKHISLANNETTSDQKKMRNIISSLYEVDMDCRFKAAKALGEIARNKFELSRRCCPVSFILLTIIMYFDTF